MMRLLLLLRVMALRVMALRAALRVLLLLLLCLHHPYPRASDE
jgi:hypothetical protein